MPTEPNPFEVRLREVFAKALEKPSTEERHRYLDAACAGDARLRSRVETMLRADERAGGFLGLNAHGEAIDLVMDASGTTIGPYGLIEKLGEGGFGTVYRAQQTKPVRREVALKIIKLGMDTKEVIARFEAERQALALMEHPNIARVYDAGATETGRPYFVMDLIVGESITDYCDQRKLPVVQRLELFLQVCDAVQHAHGRGIVHRDLKPSNVVVMEENGQPLVKVIDFGIAKSMQGRLTDRTLITRREVLLGTPVYMSPEQLNLDADQVDTRSDVYSLGVLLYELIAGAPPFESDTLRKAAFSEVQRILREVEPEKPSTRFEHLGPKTTEIAQRRALQPPELRRLLRGDLDWVVMRALEKEPARRYASAAALAEDLQHHLRHEPVRARPPSPVYRLSRLYRRHRPAVVAGAAVGVVLVVAGLFVWQQRREAERLAQMAATDAAQAQADQQFVNGVINVEQGAQLSPDETMLAYVGWDGRDADLWVRELKTGEQRNLTQSEKHNPGVYEACLDVFVWSPDSKCLAYAWNDERIMTSLRVIAVNGAFPKVSFAGTNQTYTVQLDVKALQPRVLFTESNNTRYEPDAWTHDGRQVLCRRKRPEGMALVNVDTGAIRDLPIGQVLEHPRLSPDDRYVVFSRSNHIHLLDIEAGRLTQLTFGGSHNTTPIWAPHDPVVLFSSDRLGSWDLWAVKVEQELPVPSPHPVRYGVGDHEKRLTQSGKLVIHRTVAATDGYTIGGVATSSSAATSALPGLIYFSMQGKLHTMTPDGGNKKMLPPNVGGQPSYALHGGHRWLLQIREVTGASSPSGDRRKELFAVRDDGDETVTVQLTADATRKPLEARWASDPESKALDGVISWSAKHSEGDGPEPTMAIYTAKVRFNESGNLVSAGSPWPPGAIRLLMERTPSLSQKPDKPSERCLTNVLGAGHDWSPEGSRLAYSVDDELHILDLAGGDTVTLTQGSDPRWSPDGTRIAFRRTMRSIHTINADGSDLKTLVETPRHGKVTISPSGVRNPVWSPDSSHLLYWWWEPATVHEINIYRISAEGGKAVNLTADIDNASPVAWRSTELSTTQE